MRVVLAGGTGLIGRALARDLVADGHHVSVLTRQPEAAGAGLPESVEAIGWDGRTAGDWHAAVDGASAVVNLAGAGLAEARWTEARLRLIRDSRVQSAQAVTEAVARAADRPAVVVQASAVGYYGPSGDAELDEDAPPGSDKLVTNVVLPTEAAAEAVRAHGVRVAMARTGIVLAREGGALPRMVLPFRLFVGGPLGTGRQVMSWIHIADEVRALRFLMENEAAEGPFNLTAPGPVTNAEFSRALGRVLGRPSLMPVPAPVLRLVFGEMATVLLDGQRVLPRRLLELGFTFTHAAVEPALRDVLGRR